MLAMRNPMPKSFPRAWFACRGLAIALLLAFTIRPAAAEWHVADFQATVAVDRAGGIAVTERIAVKFNGPYHGISRTIPVDYPGPDGSNYHLYLKLRGVTDGAGEPLRYESSRQGAFQKLKIYIPDAVDAERVVTISYTIPNATRFFDGYAEFYWNVTGNDWPVEIDHASANVSLPPGATGLRVQAFSGEFGAKGQDATANATGAGAVFATTQAARSPQRFDHRHLYPQWHSREDRPASPRSSGSWARIQVCSCRFGRCSS
jgi:hypothetical protein